MSLENEYYALKQALKTEEKKLAKIEAAEIVEDKNNPFTVEERLEAQQQAIKMHNEDINELKELIAEVKEELQEFINNGGEVSEITLNEFKEEETDDVEEKIVEFKIISKENENISLTGCVDINTIDDDEPDFEYANAQGFYTPQRYWDIQSETSWKLDEKERLNREYICNKVDADVCGDYSENAQCLWDFRDENITIERDSYYLIINEGVKMECEIIERPDEELEC